MLYSFTREAITGEHLIEYGQMKKHAKTLEAIKRADAGYFLPSGYIHPVYSRMDCFLLRAMLLSTCVR